MGTWQIQHTVPRVSAETNSQCSHNLLHSVWMFCLHLCFKQMRQTIASHLIVAYTERIDSGILGDLVVR